QRVRGRDLVVPKGADQQQVVHIRLRQQILEQIERRRVQPLQIVEEQHQRMFRPGEDAEEPAEHQLEPALRLLRRQLRDGRLDPDDELHLRDEADDKLAVRADRLRQGITPLFHLGFALDEDLTDQGLQGLRQGRVRDVALVLVELAGREEAARRNERLVQLVHYRGFADAGIA